MFEQIAKGEFEIEVEGPNHCGPDHTTPKRFAFEVEVRYRGRVSLDDRGFLIDNTYFQQYFSSLGRTDLSCELLVAMCAEHFKSIARDPIFVDVGLWAIPDRAYVRYRWPEEDQ